MDKWFVHAACRMLALMIYFILKCKHEKAFFLASLRLSDELTVKLLCCLKDNEDSSACDIRSLVAMEVVRS